MINLSKPCTYKGVTPADLVGQLVRVRPYYHVPAGRSCLTSARSPWTFEAWVTQVRGDMVTVRFTWETSSVPWQHEGGYYPHELHRAYGACHCPACACMGDGIHALRGA